MDIRPLTCKHWNNHLACALAIKTTGKNPQIHDLIEIACIPILPNWERDDRYKMFSLEIAPEHTTFEISELVYNQAKVRGMDPILARSVFDTWYDQLNLPANKQIIPICYNWNYYCMFLMRWLGWEDYNFYFNHIEARDPQCAAVYANDRADWNNEPPPYPKPWLGSLANRTGTEKSLKDVLERANSTREVYKNMLRQLF